MPKEQLPCANPAQKASASLRKYLYYSTILYVFSLLLMSHFGLSIRLLELNLILICLVVKVTRISRWIFWFVLYLAVSCGIGIAHGTDSFSWCILEYRAIVINVIYYFYFFRMIGNDSDRAFVAYAKVAYWFAVIGLFVWAGACILGRDFERLRGLATEPAQFCSLVLPAYYWYAHQFITLRKHAFKVITFTITVVLTASSVGYISAAFGIVLLLLSKRRKYVLIAPAIVCVLLGLAYSLSSEVQKRVNDTLLVAATGDLTGANLSTYAIISNAMVTQQVLEESPLIGNGLGSHPMSHARFLADIPGVESFIGMNLDATNALEANSLTLRVLSELGILGLLGVCAFLVHFFVGGNSPRAAISKAILVCFFLKLLRSGEYYQPEQFFFIFIYILNYRKFKHHALEKTRVAPSGLLTTPSNSLGSLAHASSAQ
jgi:hypothetical protein